MIKASTTITISCYRDVEKIIRYYKLQASTSSVPVKPSANPPSEWSDTEPSYTSGSTNTLYFCDLTVFSNGEWSYSNVSVSSSYEAAKQAYNKANAAQNSANSANDKIDELEIGGRNLAIKTNQGTLGWEWTMQVGGFTNEEVLEDNIRCCKLTRDNVEQSGWSVIYYSSQYMRPEQFKENRYYTVSLEVKPSIDSSFTMFLIDINGTNNIIDNNIGVENKTVSANVWNKLSWTFKTKTELPSNRETKVYLIGHVSNVGVSYIFKNLKVEEGNKKTAWTPAPEDINDSIDKAKEDLTQEITNQSTKVLSDAASITMSAMEECVQKSAFDEHKTNTETRLGVLSDGFNVEIETVKKKVDDLEGDIIESTEKMRYEFGTKNLEIGKQGADTTTHISEDGVRIKNSVGTDIHIVNSHGTEADNLYARRYLMVGTRSKSRFEDYEEDGELFIGAFFTGS